MHLLCIWQKSVFLHVNFLYKIIIWWDLLYIHTHTQIINFTDKIISLDESLSLFHKTKGNLIVFFGNLSS